MSNEWGTIQDMSTLISQSLRLSIGSKDDVVLDFAEQLSGIQQRMREVIKNRKAAEENSSGELVAQATG